MSEMVLDASALIALLRDEPGSAIVEKYLSNAVVSAVNLSEVISKLIQNGMPDDLAISIVDSLGLRIELFDEELAQLAARLTAKVQKTGLSLGDRACLALAQSLKLPVLTADRDWNKLNIEIDIRLIR